MYLKTVLFIFVLSASVQCNYFRLGHSKGGNLGVSGNYNNESLSKALWFDQKLNHFTRTDTRTWKQRFYSNCKFLKPGSQTPIFLMIGGEGPADPRWMVKGAWIEFAMQFNAACFMLEHRYYGESHPTRDTSPKNLQFLTSEQALADIANFIDFVNKHFVQHGPRWIVFGGSYPGSLAAWARLKYPHLVHGAVSSSGPLFAKVDFDKYFGVVVQALREKTGSDDCIDKVKQGHNEIVSHISSDPEVIEKQFKVCTPFSQATPKDMNNFYNSLAHDFAEVVQYNEDNRLSANEKRKNITINSVCKLLTEANDDPAYIKLAKFNSLILDSNNQTCLDYSYRNMISNLRNTSWSSDAGRQWMYQTCTEFGYYQTSSATADIFGNNFPVGFFTKQCEEVFGKKFNADFIKNAAHWTNVNYGALAIKTTRILFVHGTIDPWHALGITVDNMNERGTGVIFINGTAHCADMYPSSESDPPELTAARAQTQVYLRAWLAA